MTEDSRIDDRRPFNNPRVHTQSWYFAAWSKQIPRGRTTRGTVLGRRIALYRTTNGRLYALDARCPHLGADLGDGEVQGVCLVCPFHKWRFDGSGRCVAIPSGGNPPARARVFSYPVEERFGAAWIFNGPRPTFPLPDLGDEVGVLLKPVHWRLNCHHHLVVSNAIDLNHWRHVHGFTPVGHPDVQVLPHGVQVHLNLRLEQARPLFRGLRLRDIETTISILGGNMAVIEARKPWVVRLMIAHRPLGDGMTASRLFACFPSRSRLLRWARVESAIGALKLGFMGLLLMDDRRILNHLEFWPRLTSEDALLGRFLQQVNGLDVFDPKTDPWQPINSSEQAEEET